MIGLLGLFATNRWTCGLLEPTSLLGAFRFSIRLLFIIQTQLVTSVALVRLRDIMTSATFSVLPSRWTRCMSMFTVTGLRLIKGLLHTRTRGLRVTVCVSVICCPTLLDSLLGTRLTVLCKLMVRNPSRMTLWTTLLGSLARMCSGKVMPLNILRLANRVLSRNSMFTRPCVLNKLSCDSPGRPRLPI